uniref:Uncharacterized protein n=1 Tax=Anguilla anguilla TaxID=7936 RepID=A0A0E9UNU2_ANGAN
MMQKVRVLVSAFFVLYGLFHFSFSFPLRYFFYCAISLSFSINAEYGGRMFYFMLGCVLLYMVGHLFYYG